MFIEDTIQFNSHEELFEAEMYRIFDVYTFAKEKISYPIWIRPSGDQKGFEFADSNETSLLKQNSHVIRESVYWEDIKGKYWEPQNGQRCWFWNSSEDLVIAYYDGRGYTDRALYKARFESMDKNGQWVKEYKFCKPFDGELPEGLK